MKVWIIIATVSIVIATSADVAAQTRSIRDTATAYGARLDGRGRPANLNSSRLNSRIDSRIDNRLALRIERYRVDNIENPVAAFVTAQNDKSRTAPSIPPPSQVNDPE